MEQRNYAKVRVYPSQQKMWMVVAQELFLRECSSAAEWTREREKESEREKERRIQSNETNAFVQQSIGGQQLQHQ